MDRRALLSGSIASLAFTTSVALLCTTSGADRLYAALSAITMLAVFGVAMGFQIALGARAFRRGAALARPLARITLSYMAGTFAVMLAGDVVVRSVKPEFLPAGIARTVVLWTQVLAPMALVFILSAVVVAVGVGAARARLSTR